MDVKNVRSRSLKVLVQREIVKKFVVDFRLIKQNYCLPLDCGQILLIQTEGDVLVIYYLAKGPSEALENSEGTSSPTENDTMLSC